MHIGSLRALHRSKTTADMMPAGDYVHEDEAAKGAATSNAIFREGQCPSSQQSRCVKRGDRGEKHKERKDRKKKCPIFWGVLCSMRSMRCSESCFQRASKTGPIG